MNSIRLSHPRATLLRVAVAVVILLAMPFQARAAQYVVQAGDTLSSIAQRNHISLLALARANGISNLNLLHPGRVLLIPVPIQTSWYRVHWGDTLSGIALQYGTTVSGLRAMNPTLGTYPLAGQLMRVCHPCASGATYQVASTQSEGNAHVVQPGETLSSIASHFGIATSTLLDANNLTDPNFIAAGQTLTVPSLSVGASDPYGARALILRYAQLYGIEPSLALAIAWQESGFNESLVSSTGAIGVMQVEPYTEAHIRDLIGRDFNLYSTDDNIHAGIYWLSVLLRQYGGDERMAVAAYYEGSQALASHGYFQDTVQYVNNVMALKTSFGG
jgi:LysM repeat protein